jgi:uncharacterized protein (UPF0335 family)
MTLHDENKAAQAEAVAAATEGRETDSGEISGKRLKSFIERIERLEEEKKALGEDVRDVYGEAKATGFEPKIIRKIISLRKTNLEKRREEQELTELYMSAIGMVE